MSKCQSCMFRGDTRLGTPERPGCNYLILTGCSRVKVVYKKLGITEMTERARRMLDPERCKLYREGDRREAAGMRIVLEGSARKYQRLDPEKAAALYRQGLHDGQIAEALGCSRETVGRWREREGLENNYMNRGRSNGA